MADFEITQVKHTLHTIYLKSVKNSDLDPQRLYCVLTIEGENDNKYTHTESDKFEKFAELVRKINSGDLTLLHASAFCVGNIGGTYSGHYMGGINKDDVTIAVRSSGNIIDINFTVEGNIDITDLNSLTGKLSVAPYTFPFYMDCSEENCKIFEWEDVVETELNRIESTGNKVSVNVDTYRNEVILDMIITAKSETSSPGIGPVMTLEEKVKLNSVCFANTSIETMDIKKLLHQLSSSTEVYNMGGIAFWDKLIKTPLPEERLFYGFCIGFTALEGIAFINGNVSPRILKIINILEMQTHGDIIVQIIEDNKEYVTPRVESPLISSDKISSHKHNDMPEILIK